MDVLGEKDVKVEVAGLGIDPSTQAPILVLKTKSEGELIPIWIGPLEASAIAFELEGRKLPRPMTHDLFKSIIEQMGGVLSRVTVVDLKDNTYYATMLFSNKEGGTISVDARPSDAIAIALRYSAPIFCAIDVIERAQVMVRAAAEAENATSDEEQITAHDDRLHAPKPVVDLGSFQLEALDPEDFGEYEM